MTPQLAIYHHTATITLCRPEQANRLTPEDLTVLASHIATVNSTPSVWVLRLESTGKYFCSGFDINQIGAAAGNSNSNSNNDNVSDNVSFDALVNAVEDARPVTLAIMQGGVYGGATDLALACDFRLGTPHVNMFMPAARLGLHFYQRGLQRFVSRLGLNTAKRLFLTAEKIDAQTMLDCGFLTHLLDAADLLPTANELTDTLASMAPLALLGMKKHLNTLGRGELNTKDLAHDIAQAAGSQDLREGAAAWAAKRPPQFEGR